MNDFVHTTANDDHGGVHTNSGIHNRAAYLILTARDAKQQFIFDPVTVARLFYLTLTQDLSRTSKFLDSRRGVEKWTKSLFRHDPVLEGRLGAVRKAFDTVGISEVGFA